MRSEEKKYEIIPSNVNKDVLLKINGKIIRFSHSEAEIFIDDIENEILNFKSLHDELERISKDMENGNKVELKCIRSEEEIREQRNIFKNNLNNFKMQPNFPKDILEVIQGKIDILEWVLGD